MATIHVIYVPDRKTLVVPTEMLHQLKASYALLTIPDTMTDDQVADTANKLATMVLESSVPLPPVEQQEKTNAG